MRSRGFGGLARLSKNYQKSSILRPSSLTLTCQPASLVSGLRRHQFEYDQCATSCWVLRWELRLFCGLARLWGSHQSFVFQLDACLPVCFSYLTTMHTYDQFPTSRWVLGWNLRLFCGLARLWGKSSCLRYSNRRLPASLPHPSQHPGVIKGEYGQCATSRWVSRWDLRLFADWPGSGENHHVCVTQIDACLPVCSSHLGIPAPQ